jgi:putative transposase
MVLDHAREYHQDNGSWISKSTLQKLTKGKYALAAQSVQAVVHAYDHSRNAARAARAKGYKQKYPYKTKVYFNTTWANNSFRIVNKRTILLTMGLEAQDGSKRKRHRKPLKLRVASLPHGKIKRIECCYNHQGLYLVMVYDDGKETPESKTVGQVAAIDPGEINAISSVSEAGDSLILPGRLLRSLHHYRNKELGSLQTSISKTQPGSLQRKKLLKAKRKLLDSMDAQILDTLHKISSQYVNWCLEHNIRQVIVGDVEGVQLHTRRGSKNQRRSKKVAQKLSQWSFGRLYDLLEYKLLAEGITIEKVNEAYTTQTCPVCGKRNKCSSRNYKYECHRDLHGASNILTWYLYREFKRLTLKQLKYLRIERKLRSLRSSRSEPTHSLNPHRGVKNVAGHSDYHYENLGIVGHQITDESLGQTSKDTPQLLKGSPETPSLEILGRFEEL